MGGQSGSPETSIGSVIMERNASHALFALLLATGSLHAAATDEASLTIACADQRPPLMAAVGAVTGIDNVGEAFAMREKLLHQAARLCKNPAVAVVHFVPDSTVTVEPMRLAAR
jgi:hypothetical protein